MAAEWFLVKNGKELGPFSAKQLKDLADSGSLERTQLLRRADKKKIVRAEKVAGLFTPQSRSETSSNIQASNPVTIKRPPPPPSRLEPGSPMTTQSAASISAIQQPTTPPPSNGGMPANATPAPAKQSRLSPNITLLLGVWVGLGLCAAAFTFLAVTGRFAPLVAWLEAAGGPKEELRRDEANAKAGQPGKQNRREDQPPLESPIERQEATAETDKHNDSEPSSQYQNKNEKSTAGESSAKPPSQNNAAPPENEPGSVPSLPRNARRLKSLMNTPDGLGRAPAHYNDDANNAVGNLAVYATNSEVIISFDGSGRNWPVINAGAHMLVRLFDSNGQYLTHITTSETFTGEPRVAKFKPGFILLKGTNNRFIYPVNKRDLRDAAIVEVGFFFDW